MVQDPGNSQSYNRYSYCLNNPLKYTDPSGYILEQQDLPPDPDQRAAGEEFYRKFSGSSGIDGGIGGWYTAYRQALNKGYTGDLVKFMDMYDRQVFSPNFNGSLTYTYYTTSYEKYVEPGCGLPGITARQTRHDIIINFTGQGGWLDGTMNWGIEPSSNLATAVAGLKYTSSNFLREGYWRGANGQYYSLSLTQKGTQGWRFYERSANIANNSVRWIGFVGEGLGYLSLGYSANKFRTDPSLSNGIDFGVGVGSVVFWEVGAVYYGGKSFYELSSTYNSYLMNSGINPGMQFIINKE